MSATTSDKGDPSAIGRDGCSTRLAPAIGAKSPSALGADGPWQLCGAYGTGSGHIVKTSADGRRTALLTDSGQAWVLETNSFDAHGPFLHGNGGISFVGLSPDGRLLATVDDAGSRVGIWDVNRKRLLRVLSRPPLVGPSYYGLGDVAFSSDGRRVAVVSGSHIDVFDVATGTPLPISARTDLGGAMRVAFAASDHRLVFASFVYFGNGPFAGFGSVAAVDADTGDNLIALAGPPLGSTLAAFAVSGNGRVVAVGAAEPGFVPITLFDPRSGATLATLAIAGVPLALDATGRNVALVEPAADGSTPPPGSPLTVSVRRISDATIVRSVTVAGGFLAVPDLNTLLVGDRPPHVLSRLRIADGTTRAVACGSGHSGNVIDLGLTHDRRVLVSTGDSADGGARLAWDVATGAPRSSVPDPADLFGPSAVSPDGTLIVEPEGPTSDNFVLRSIATGVVVRTFGPQPSVPATFDFSPLGALIASGSDHGPADRQVPPVADVWITASGQLEQALLIVTSLPQNTAQPVLFISPRRLLVAGLASTALWCR